MMRRFAIGFVLTLLSLAPVWASPLSQAPPRPINYGQTVEGELDDVQRALQFIFDGSAGDEITILLATTSGDLDVSLSLATFDGQAIADDDNSGGGTDALIEATLERSGSYVITASRSRDAATPGTGSFTLLLQEATAVEAEAVVTVEPTTRLQPILRGTPVQGSLAQGAAFSLLWFEGRADEVISISSDPGTSLQPLLAVYDALFNEIARGSGGNALSTTLPEDGLYFLGVALPDRVSIGGNYAVTLTSGEAVQTAPPRDAQPGQNAIQLGEQVRGAISNITASYTFQFSGAANDEVTIAMSRVGGDLDSYVYLLDASGVTIAENDNGGDNNADALLTAQLPADGNYIILATRAGQASGTTAGNFILSLASDDVPIQSTVIEAAPIAPVGVPPNLANLPQLRFGQTQTGEINDGVFLQPYVFEAEAEDEIVLDMVGTGDLDPLLLLLNANQEPLAENDDIQPDSNRNSQIQFTIPESGFYVAVATRFDQENGISSGGYELTLRRASDPAPTNFATDSEPSSDLVLALNPQRIRPGLSPSGEFNPSQFARVYGFTVTNGDLVDFAISTDSNVPVTIMMTDDRLQPLAISDESSLLGIPLPASGTYLFFVAPAFGPAANVADNYILAFNATGGDFVSEGDFDEPLATPTPAEPEEIPIIGIAYGERITGTITETALEQDYTFTGSADDVVRINMTALPGSGLDTYIELLNPSGTPLAENDDIVPGQDRNSFLQATLPTDGEYTIRATRYGGETAPPSTGDYELTLNVVDPTAAGVNPNILPIFDNQPVANAVNETQYLMFYSFSGNSGDIATIQVNTVSGDLDAVLYLYAYTTAGDPIEIARNDDSPRGGTFDPLLESIVLPRTGDYLIGVGRFPEGTSEGEFTMTLDLQSPVEVE